MLKSNFLNLFKKYENNIGHHVSLREFCSLTGISRSIASKLFHNKVKGFKFDTLDKLANFFQVSPNKLLIYKNKAPMILELRDLTRQDSQDVIGDIPHSYSVSYTGISLSLLGFKHAVHVNFMALRPDMFGYKFCYEIGPDRVLYNFLNTSYNKYFKYIFNHQFPKRLMHYIYSRLVLHSGYIKRASYNKLPSINYDDFTMLGTPTSRPCQCTLSSNYLLKFPDITFKDGIRALIHLWKKQPNEYNKYHERYKLISSYVGQPIKIHDYTTNNFKDD